LDEKGSEALSFDKRCEGVLDGFLFLIGSRPFVCEPLVELDGKSKSRIRLGTASPGGCCPRDRGTIEGAVDLNDVEKTDEECKRIEAGRFQSGVEDTLPIWVGPSSNTDPDGCGFRLRSDGQ
jgi:hypothetical protein